MAMSRSSRRGRTAHSGAGGTTNRRRPRTRHTPVRLAAPPDRSSSHLPIDRPLHVARREHDACTEPRGSRVPGRPREYAPSRLGLREPPPAPY
jgi:hypothetical protein